MDAPRQNWFERRPRTARWLLAGPGAVFASVLIMAAMPKWWPEGAAGVDNLVFPLILLPMIWAAVFFYACLTERLGRAAAVIGGLIVVNLGVVVLSFVGG